MNIAGAQCALQVVQNLVGGGALSKRPSAPDRGWDWRTQGSPSRASLASLTRGQAVQGGVTLVPEQSGGRSGFLVILARERTTRNR